MPLTGKYSIPALEARFAKEVESNPRVAAEIAYALAWRHRSEFTDKGSPRENAKRWAERAIELLDSLPSETIEQVASTTPSIGGVALPDLLHSGVVRERLADVLRSQDDVL